MKAFLLSAFLASALVSQAADWPTYGHDPQRTGWALGENTLNPGNVSQLELKWKTHVKNQSYQLSALTAPVIAAHVSTSHGERPVAYVAGTGNRLFALDVETGELLWEHDFHSHVRSAPGGWQQSFLCPDGITATPAIDRATNNLYVISEDGALYGLDLGSGRVNYGPVQFVAPFAKALSLNLVNGVLYTTLSQGCGGGISGIYSVELAHPLHPVLRQLLLSRTDTSGIWGRGGAVAGKNGRIYGSTADGNFSLVTGDYSNSVIAANLADLQLVDYFNPTNWEHLTHRDLDFGSASPVWFGWKNYNLLAAGAKEGVIYLLDADDLAGKDHATPLYASPRMGNDEQTFERHGIWGGISMARDADGQPWIYAPMWGPVAASAPSFPATNGAAPHGSIMAFRLAADGAGKPKLDPAWISEDFNLPDPPAIANGIVFAVSTGENAQQGRNVDRLLNTRPAVLFALDAKTGKTLYSSGSAFTSWVHFSGLAIAEGRVFAVDHDSNVYCFGLKGK